MLIRNYGSFWKQEDVFWERRNVRGSLKGICATDKGFGPVDFRDQQGVYALYDDSFKLIYVGQAGAGENYRLFDRLRNHTSNALAQRWSRFSWFGVRQVKSNGELAMEVANRHPSVSDALNHIEAILISAAEPLHNKQGGRFGESVEQYLQHRDQELLGPTIEEMIRDVWRQRG